jgi:beta-ureidopropionase / N-carbamoyl-L-amino-acid hydrolase
MAHQRWKEDIIAIGQMGRKVSQRIESYDQLDLEKGQYRLEGTSACKKSKEYVIAKMKEAGLEVRIDSVGNIFARKEGRRASKGAVMSGSHLDSVLNGGMFDGVLGVVSALEAVRRMNDEGFENERPIEVAAFMGEEGSAFKKALLGSLVLAGRLPDAEALAISNDKNVTLKEALDKQKLRGDFVMDLDDVAYFIETHVEQGPVLDTEKIPIGIVENITGLTWINAMLNGEENHAGTTPMASRSDPLVAAAEIVTLTSRRANEMVKSFGGSTVATVGKMIVKPGAHNIVPGTVEMGIDIRDGDPQKLQKLKEQTILSIKKLEERYGVKSIIEVAFDHPPCPCSPEVVNTIEDAATDLSVKARRMNSGAGHDAQNLAEKVKTAMIFVPSISGISHSPMEWTNWDDIENGIKVLTQVLKNLSAA